MGLQKLLSISLRRLRESSRMDSSFPSEKLSTLSISENAGSSNSQSKRELHLTSAQSKGKAKAKSNGNKKPITKLRGRDNDSPEVRTSKTISWLLRHAAENEGLPMRLDGYVRVTDMLNHPKLKATNLTLEGLKVVVGSDDKQRFDLIFESAEGQILEAAASEKGSWWMRARQGHSMKSVKLALEPILSLKDIPTGIAVHGTNRQSWNIIAREGLSKMKRNHIHIAQEIAGKNVVSGMRTSSQILIYIDVEKALASGLKFWFSENGVILTEGDENGYLSRKFFQKVVDIRHGELNGWEES